MPSLSEALDFVNVQDILLQAWNLTQANNVEYGGLIIHDPATNTYTATRRTDNQNSSIILTRPADIAAATAGGREIIADYHCHPDNGVASGRPSDADITNGRGLRYKRIVFTRDTYHLYPQDLYRKALPCPSPANFPAETCMWRVT